MIYIFCIITQIKNFLSYLGPANIIATLAFIVSIWTIVYTISVKKTDEIQGLIKMFFDLQETLPKGTGDKLSEHHMQSICNYFDYVCWHIIKKRFKSNDFDILLDVMHESMFVDFMKDYRTKHGDGYLIYYKTWLDKNPKK